MAKLSYNSLTRIYVINYRYLQEQAIDLLEENEIYCVEIKSLKKANRTALKAMELKVSKDKEEQHKTEVCSLNA